MHPEFYDWADRVALAITARNPEQAPYVATTGMVFEDRGSVEIVESIAVASLTKHSSGLLIQGPMADDFTPYRVTVRGVVHPSCDIVVQYGAAEAAPTNNAAGEKSNAAEVLACGVGFIDFDAIICVTDPGIIDSVDYTGRALCFSASVRNPTGSSVTNSVSIRMTVERMVRPMPRFYDRRVG